MAKAAGRHPVSLGSVLSIPWAVLCQAVHEGAGWTRAIGVPASRGRGCRKGVLWAHAQKSWNLPVNAVRRTALLSSVFRRSERGWILRKQRFGVLGHVVHAGFVL